MPELVDRLGRLPSPDDPRDFSIRAILPRLAGVALPARYRIASWDRIGRFDQQENSCVGQSITALKIVQERRRTFRHYALDPLFLWNETKKADGIGNPDEDRGTYPRVALKVMQDHGHSISGTSRFDARFKIGEYFRLTSPEEIKAAIYLLGGGGVALGSWWYASWDETLPSGMLPAPDREVGGHATAAYGWNDFIECPDGTLGAIIAANSWGDTWGVRGNFMIPYSLIGPAAPFDEMWKVLDA